MSNRQHLFRGKRKDTGEWVYGDLRQDRDLELRYIGGYNYYSGGLEGLQREPFEYEVIPKTVGEWTGLCDKNGVKIFEDDIVRCTDEHSGLSFVTYIKFGNPNGEYNWGFQMVSVKNVNTDILLWVDTEETGAYIEVIGNIHDNPELLEVSKC